jgi:opacity protein-like surface antigen
MRRRCVQIIWVKWTKAILVLLGTAAMGSLLASAQTDVSASVYGTFNNGTRGNGTIQNTPNSGGGMIGVRHVFNPLVGLEVDFGINPSKQSLSPDTATCGFRCGNQPLNVSATAIAASADYVVSAKFGNLRPFGLVGLGFVFTNTSGTEIGLNSLSRPAYLGGGGTDVDLTPHVGLRVQYRVNVYKAPDVDRGYSPTGAYVYTQEPMVGAFFRF